jgi:hypothetical protein
MMKLEAPERDVPADPAVLRLPPAALLVVAGVPWAGKTTLLSRVEAPGSLVLDPEPLRDRFARVLAPVPYRLWRPLVHAEHFLRVLPALPARRGLIAHDTGTPAGAASEGRWPPPATRDVATPMGIPPAFMPRAGPRSGCSTGRPPTGWSGW